MTLATQSRVAGPPLLIATRSAGKLAELTTLFAALGRPILTLDQAGIAPSPDEDALEVFDTFEANAVAKARYYHAATGLPTVADDSGLSVDALGGAPGVYSRRWAGAVGNEAVVSDANNALLLRRLDGESNRGAEFVCVVAYTDGVVVLTRRGVTRGRIALAARGTQGFGYDPLFEAEDLGDRTFGEASRAEKQQVSHRARAFAALTSAIAALGVSVRTAR